MWVTGRSQVHTTALAFSSGAEDPNSGPPACVASTLPPEPSPSEERLCSTLVSSSKPALKVLHPIMPLLGSQNSCASSRKAFWVMWVFGAFHQSVFFLDCEDLLGVDKPPLHPVFIYLREHTMCPEIHFGFWGHSFEGKRSASGSQEA